MKNILNVIRILIIIYLVAFTAIMVSMYTKRKVYNDMFPTVLGYTYIKVDTDIYEPDIKKNNIIILKETKAVDVNDYVVYKYTNTTKLGKVEKVDKYNIYVKDDNGVLNEYNLQNVYGKMIYNNDTFSKVMNILTNWIVLVILLFVGTLLPELIFNN